MIIKIIFFYSKIAIKNTQDNKQDNKQDNLDFFFRKKYTIDMNIKYPPFTITNEMLSLVSLIMEKIGKVDSFDNLSKYPILRKKNRVKSIHANCAIEANSLSLDQVKSVINGTQVLGPQKDIIEIQNAIKAYDKIEKINPLSESELKYIHGILGNYVIDNAGEYRTGNEGVTNSRGSIIFIAPPPNLVPQHMKDLFSWINEEYKDINPLILSSVFHYEFVFIHPFSDGNGRTARFFQSALLGKWKEIFYWLPIESQIHKYQKEYYKAINDSNLDGSSNPFIMFMLKMINKTFDELLEDANQIDYSSSIYLNKLLVSLKPNVWYTANQILDLLNLKSKETLRKNYLNPAISKNLMILEYPDKITSRNQRYKIVK